MNTYKKWACLIIIMMSLLPTLLNAQVGFNAAGNDPDPSAMLDVSSTNKGILLPRMTAAQRDAISNPADGLIVFVTDDNNFYYFDGIKWDIMGSVDSDLNLQDLQPGDSLYYDQPSCEETLRIRSGPASTTRTGSAWQSFTSVNTGHLCEIGVFIGFYRLDAGFVRIYKGEGTSGALMYEGLVENLINPSSGVMDTIPFPEEAVYLEKDSLYTLQLEDTVNVFAWGRRTVNIYNGGRSSLGGDFFMQMFVRQRDLYLWGDFMAQVIEDPDQDATNEFQNLSISGTELSLSKSDTLDLIAARDNLGNHTATQNVRLNNNWLSRDGDDEGISVDNDGKVGIGVSPDSITAAFDVRHSMKFVNGTEGEGKVLVSDASGFANWETPGYGKEILSNGQVLEGITVNESRLSNILHDVDTIYFADGTWQASQPHDMQQNVEMNGNWISRDGDNEGIMIDADGNVGIGTSPSTDFDIDGTLKFDNPNDPNGTRVSRVLLSDDDGNAFWGFQTRGRVFYGTRSYNNSNTWRNVLSGFSSPGGVGQTVKLEAIATLRLTGGSGTDDFEIRAEVNYSDCGSTSGFYTNTMKYRPSERAQEHDNAVIVMYKDIYTPNACSSGNAAFTLQIRNTGDDAWEVKDICFLVTIL